MFDVLLIPLLLVADVLTTRPEGKDRSGIQDSREARRRVYSGVGGKHGAMMCGGKGRRMTVWS